MSTPSEQAKAVEDKEITDRARESVKNILKEFDLAEELESEDRSTSSEEYIHMYREQCCRRCCAKSV